VTFTPDYLDPKLFGANFTAKPSFTRESDYYSLAVMLFHSLVMVHPFGGVHPDYPNVMRRAEARVPVFDPRVKYPKKGLHFHVLPDDLLQYFHRVFVEDNRHVVPEQLLSALQFRTCPQCGTRHARSQCPTCVAAPLQAKEAITYHGKCTATRVFKTRGRILAARIINGQIDYLHEESGVIKRRSGEEVRLKPLTGNERLAMTGQLTLIGTDSRVDLVRHGKVEDTIATEKLGTWPMFDANDRDYFTISGGYLARNNQDLVGQILLGHTWFRVGQKFGFGFYRVGRKIVYFMFDALKKGIDDTIKLPQYSGKIVDAECIFSDDYCLFSISRVESGQVINAFHLLKKDGTVIASTEALAESSRFTKNIRAKVLGGQKIITATDDGLLLVIPDNGRLVESKLFTDTEPFVNEGSEIYTNADGIYVISEKEILLLRLL
jgi:H/ACA ribonucleoprotein complex subunit 3